VTKDRDFVGEGLLLTPGDLNKHLEQQTIGESDSVDVSIIRKVGIFFMAAIDETGVLIRAARGVRLNDDVFAFATVRKLSELLVLFEGSHKPHRCQIQPRKRDLKDRSTRLRIYIRVNQNNRINVALFLDSDVSDRCRCWNESEPMEDGNV
jgi:hypothetical protein